MTMDTTPYPTTVVIADDSEKVRRRIRSVLGAIPDQQAAEVGNGPEHVLGAVARYRPDVLIIDIHGTNGKGIETLRRIHLDYPETDIVVLTNKADRFYRRACLKAGARFFIDKSIDFERVREAVEIIRREQS